MKKMLLLLSVLVLSSIISAQTPGLILRDAGTGASILDPDGDGYVSQKTDGVQIGFTIPPNSDYTQSEIPYAAMVYNDPLDDLEQGRACSFSELIGETSPNFPAVGAYYDGTNMLFRVRVAYLIENSKAFSILIDTDSKFGFTGYNADPNAVPGNPGFEVEITMMNNFGVQISNVDGTTSPVEITTLDYENHVQKSMAISNYCGDADFLFDFYVPFSNITSIPGLGITTSTPLRFAVVTNMNPSPSIGSNSLSDVGGSSNGSTIDDKFIDVINSQTPSPIGEINNGIESRTECPTLDAVYTTSTSISGTTTEADGTVIEVKVFEADGTTLISTGTGVASAGIWSITVASFSPALTLSVGQVVKASATAPGKTQSSSDCDNEFVVTDCSTQTDPPLDSEINIVPGDKGYRVTIDRPIGTKVYVYNSDGTLFDVALLKVGTTNPMISTTRPQTMDFECQTGSCFDRAIGSSVYVFKFEEPGSCLSYEFLSCDYASGVSATPVVSTNPITISTTTISGTGSSVDAQILLYINDLLSQATTVNASAPYAYSFTVANLELGDKVEIRQIETGKCYSPFVTIYVTRPAFPPTIITPACQATFPLTSISGTSIEATGSTVTVYKLNPSRTAIGTAIVQADRTWTLTGLSLAAGDEITAAITTAPNTTTSADAAITLLQQTSVNNFTVAITQPIEGATSVSGTISGGTYPTILNLFVEDVLIGSTAVNAAGNWTISGLNSFDLTTGAHINVSITETGKCESAYSPTEVTVACNAPNLVNISATVQSFCDGTYGEIRVENSELGIYYVPVLAADSSIFGYGKMGNGGVLNLTLTTYQITEPVNVSIMASRIPVGYCETFVANDILFSPGARPVEPIAASVQYFCGTQTLDDLVVNVPEGTTLKWYDASSGGVELPGSTVLVNGTDYFAEALCDSNLCTSTNRTLITAEEGNPLPPVAQASQLICTESSLSDIAASSTGPGTVVWYADEARTTPLPINTALVTGTTYYAAVVNGACSSSTVTAVAVTLGMVPDTTTWTGAVSADWTDDANWNTKHPTICSHVIIPDVGNGVIYPVISAPAACQSITFEPGGAVLGLQHLSYTQAYVQIKLQRNKWYTLTAPLKSMFSGDYYFTGAPITAMKLFDDVNPDKEGDTTAVGTWTQSFANLTVPLTPGMGYAFKVDTLSWNYPNGTYVTLTDYSNAFPRANPDGSLLRKVSPYSSITGLVYPQYAQTMPKDSAVAYRFAMENASNVLEDVRVPIKPGLNLIGNPLMTHLDFDLLYASNSDKISDNLKFWNGTSFISYMSGVQIAASMDKSFTRIPPMQAFFVNALPGVGDGTQLDINLNEHFVTDELTKLRSTSATVSKVLHIKSSFGGYQSYAAIAHNENAHNGCSTDDAFKLFSQYSQVPEIYTVAEEKALDINQFGSMPYMAPIGIKTSVRGKIALNFEGANNFEDVEVTLLNTLTGEQQNLKVNKDYELNYDGTATDASLFVEFRSANTSTDTPEAQQCELNKCLQVFAQDNRTITAISPNTDKILKMTIWEQDGKQLYNKTDIKNTINTAQLTTTCKICVVRVETETKTFVIKVLMDK